MDKLNLNRVVLLLRGVSGSSKTTFATFLKQNSLYRDDVVICCADDEFTDENGNYNFDSLKLGVAHKQCQDKFIKALESGTELVIVANTNTKIGDFIFYIDGAHKFGYTLFSLVVEKRFEGGNNGHKVPLSTLQRQEANIINSLKLR